MSTKYEMSAASLTFALLNEEGKKLKGAPFTVKSRKSGKDFTYLIAQKPYEGKMYVHVYIETLYLDFKYLGHFKHGKLWRKGAEVTTEAAQGIAWILAKLVANEAPKVDASAIIYHMGACARCGKPLTDAKSIEIGIGPVCRGGI